MLIISHKLQAMKVMYTNIECRNLQMNSDSDMESGTL